jgi:hypothetical protein
VLELEVSSRHVTTALDVTRAEAALVGDVELVDDHEAEGIEHGLGEGLGQAVGMPGFDEAHFLGELEVKEEDAAAGSAPGLVIDVAVGNRVAQAMRAVDFGKAGIVAPRVILGRIGRTKFARGFTHISPIGIPIGGLERNPSVAQSLQG